MIRVEGLKKMAGRRLLWSGLDMTVAPGQIATVIGRSGSGKTTLLNCLALLERPTEGKISHNEITTTGLRRSNRRRYRRDNVAILMQGLALVEDASVAENLRLACMTRQVFADRHRVVLSRVGMAGAENERIYHLSGGEQQRVALAQVLLKAAPLVLLDEPTSALDSPNMKMVLEVIAELKNAGAAVIVATHNRHVRAIADVEYDLDGLVRGSAG